jgi:hypothetical protein
MDRSFSATKSLQHNPMTQTPSSFANPAPLGSTAKKPVKFNVIMEPLIKKPQKRNAATAQLNQDCYTQGLLGDVENPECLAYWRVFDSFTDGALMDRFCHHFRIPKLPYN